MKLVASLLYQEGFLLNKYKFKSYRPIGRVSPTIQRLEELQIDEVVFLNKTHTSDPTADFIDLQERESGLRQLTTPIGYGGGIKTLEQAQKLIYSGVERVVLSASEISSSLSKEISGKFGEQAIIFHIPYYFIGSKLMVHTSRSLLSGDEVLSKLPREFGGELMLTSTNSEGTGRLDSRELRCLEERLPLEVAKVYSGGIQEVGQIEELSQLGFNGICLGNVLNTKETFVLNAKRSCSAITRPVQND
jgi:cyclase